MNKKPLAQAVLETLIYSDIFDQPLKLEELHRFLHGYRTPLPELETQLRNGLLNGLPVVRSERYLLITGRDELPERRREAERLSLDRWPAAVRYGRRLARMPFVRMVGLTGALAVSNAREEDDLDYLVVSTTGRIWTSRLFILVLVRLAARQGVTLCPNYFLSEDALELEDRSIFTARELAQMVLLAGAETYDRMRRLNPWTDDQLPNAAGPPRPLLFRDPPGRVRFAERLLTGTAGDRLERWEMGRKVRKFSREKVLTAETAFDPHRVQGHFNGYRARTLAEYERRRERFDLKGIKT